MAQPQKRSFGEMEEGSSSGSSSPDNTNNPIRRKTHQPRILYAFVGENNKPSTPTLVNQLLKETSIYSMHDIFDQRNQWDWDPITSAQIFVPAFEPVHHESLPIITKLINMPAILRLIVFASDLFVMPTEKMPNVPNADQRIEQFLIGLLKRQPSPSAMIRKVAAAYPTYGQVNRDGREVLSFWKYIQHIISESPELDMEMKLSCCKNHPVIQFRSEQEIALPNVMTRSKTPNARMFYYLPPNSKFAQMMLVIHEGTSGPHPLFDRIYNRERCILTPQSVSPQPIIPPPSSPPASPPKAPALVVLSDRSTQTSPPLQSSNDELLVCSDSSADQDDSDTDTSDDYDEQIEEEIEQEFIDDNTIPDMTTTTTTNNQVIRLLDGKSFADIYSTKTEEAKLGCSQIDPQKMYKILIDSDRYMGVIPPRDRRKGHCCPSCDWNPLPSIKDNKNIQFHYRLHYPIAHSSEIPLYLCDCCNDGLFWNSRARYYHHHRLAKSGISPPHSSLYYKIFHRATRVLSGSELLSLIGSLNKSI